MNQRNILSESNYILRSGIRITFATSIRRRSARGEASGSGGDEQTNSFNLS